MRYPPTIVSPGPVNEIELIMDFVFIDIISQIDGNEKKLLLNLHSVEGTIPDVHNYVAIDQNTDEWQELRKNKITASRLPTLIGLNGKKSFDIYWRIVNEGLQERDVMNTEFNNFKRGHIYESEALKFFGLASSSHPIPCGFFHHPSDNLYGASPDGIVGPGILVEIKTRASNSLAPLESITKQHYVQCQLQIAVQMTKGRISFTALSGKCTQNGKREIEIRLFAI